MLIQVVLNKKEAVPITKNEDSLLFLANWG